MIYRTPNSVIGRGPNHTISVSPVGDSLLLESKLMDSLGLLGLLRIPQESFQNNAVADKIVLGCDFDQLQVVGFSELL
jgi:hypothetical protein